MRAIQNHPLLLLLHILVLSLLPLKTTSSARSQAEALVKWKNSLSSSSPSLNSWSSTNLNNLCNWTAIVCDTTTRTATKIDLSNFNVSGTLAQFNFTPFVNLTVFNLNNNTLSGPIPSAIGNLSKLTLLDLGDNFLEGEIPLEISQLTELRYFSLHNNNLNGTIPYQLSNLQKVWYFDLGANYLLSPDWSKFSSMPLLTYLDLFLNSFASQFPVFISDCRNLTFLDLSQNQLLTGQVPEWVFSNLGKLEYLNLTNCQFRGPLSSNISKLSNLIHLNLANNHFNGSIPDEIGFIPHLQHLDLFNNSFEGQIPSSIGQLKELLYLDLITNLLNSTIPSELGSCTNLTYLALSDNYLSGELPKSLSNLISIAQLGLSGNLFSGALSPDLISNWTQLQALQLQYNSFSGRIPSEIGMLKNLSFLHLGHNNFSGPIPSEIGNLKLLDYLDLSTNHLSGPIPLEIETLKVLTYLDFSTNHLSGKDPNLETQDLHSNKLQGPLVVPSFSVAYFIISGNNLSGSIHPLFCRLIHLRVLDVSDNNLTGIIPPCLGKHGTSVLELRTLDLSNNQLQGKVPHSLVQCRNLEILNLGHNLLTDTFPFWLAKLPKLHVLVLRSNKFYGPIWHQNKFSGFMKLRIIDLSFNEFSGNLRSEIFRSWNAMTEVSNRNNSSPLRYMGDGSYYHDSVTVMNKGLAMELVKIITIFTSIDLSNNRFDGEIPSSIGNLQSLHVLNLSSNSFAGLIPSSFGNLKELESLDLSNNKLSGRIPEELRKLSFLAYLNISQNHLTGPIPQGEQFSTFPISAFEGNGGLFGRPLTENCEGTETPTSQKNQESKFDFGWRVVAMGYGCGVVVGVVAGHVIISKWPNWFSKTFGVNLQRRRRRTCSDCW